MKIIYIVSTIALVATLQHLKAESSYAQVKKGNSAQETGEFSPMKGPFYYADQCPALDPLCIEKIKPNPDVRPILVPSAKPTPAVTPKPLAVATPKAAESLPVPAPTVAAIPSSTIRPSGVQTSVTETGTKYVFDGTDAINGERHSVEDQITAGSERSSYVRLKCFDPYYFALSNPAIGIEQVKAEYKKLLFCSNPCMTQQDAQFLTDCTNWDAETELKKGNPEYFSNPLAVLSVPGCTEAKKNQGLAEAAYAGWHSNNDESGCEVLPGAKNALEREKAWIAKKFEDEFKRTGLCPQNMSDIMKLRSVGEYLRTQNYDSDVSRLMVGRPGSISCGYNFSTAVWSKPEHFYCVNQETCYRSQLEYGAEECDMYSRKSFNEKSFLVTGPTCTGKASWRMGGRMGDLTLISLGRGVFLEQLLDDQDKVFYVGLIFPNRLRH